MQLLRLGCMSSLVSHKMGGTGNKSTKLLNNHPTCIKIFYKKILQFVTASFVITITNFDRKFQHPLSGNNCVHL